jgi:hypothetical protein
MYGPETLGVMLDRFVAPKDRPEPMEHLDLTEQMELLDPKDHKDHPVMTEHLDLTEQMEHLA